MTDSSNISFFAYCKLKQLSKSTIEYYKTVIGYLERFAGKPVQKISLDDLLSYQRSLAENNLAPATVRNYLLGLKVVFRYLERPDLVDAIILPKVGKKVSLYFVR